MMNINNRFYFARGAALLLLSWGCGSATADQAGTQPLAHASAETILTSQERWPEAPLDSLECPNLDIYLTDSASYVARQAGLDVQVQLSSGEYAYAAALTPPALYSLRSLLDRIGDGFSWLDDPSPDLADIDMNVLSEATRDYRLDGTCGQIYVESYLGDHDPPVEVYYILDAETRSLVLYDSLGNPAGVLPPLGGHAASSGRALPMPASPRITFDLAGPALVSASGRA